MQSEIRSNKDILISLRKTWVSMPEFRNVVEAAAKLTKEDIALTEKEIAELKEGSYGEEKES